MSKAFVEQVPNLKGPSHLFMALNQFYNFILFCQPKCFHDSAFAYIVSVLFRR